MAPDIMTRNISRKNDESQDTHLGVIGDSYNARNKANRKGIDMASRTRIVVRSDVQALQYCNESESFVKLKTKKEQSEEFNADPYY